MLECETTATGSVSHEVRLVGDSFSGESSADGFLNIDKQMTGSVSATSGAEAPLWVTRKVPLDTKTVDAKSDLRGYIAFRQAFAIYGVHTFSEVDHVETDDIASVNTVPL